MTVALSIILQGSIRDYDIAARIGGEEFLILLLTRNQTVGLKVAEKLRQVLALGLVGVGHRTLTTTASFGVGCAIAHGDISQSFQLADERLYQAKEAGKNCVR